jgi:hypothetical protein
MLDVRCSTFISFSFDLTGRSRPEAVTSPFKPETGHLIRPRRRTRPRPRPRNRKQFKSIEDEHEDEDDYEAKDELNLNSKFLIRLDYPLFRSVGALNPEPLNPEPLNPEPSDPEPPNLPKSPTPAQTLHPDLFFSNTNYPRHRGNCGGCRR